MQNKTQILTQRKGKHERQERITSKEAQTTDKNDSQQLLQVEGKVKKQIWPMKHAQEWRCFMQPTAFSHFPEPCSQTVQNLEAFQLLVSLNYLCKIQKALVVVEQQPREEEKHRIIYEFVCRHLKSFNDTEKIDEKEIRRSTNDPVLSNNLTDRSIFNSQEWGRVQ